MSYSYFSISDKQSLANTFKSGCLDVTIVDNNAFYKLEHAYPITDKEGLELEPYTFKVKNNCNEPTNYQINLESLNETSNTLASEHVKVSLQSSRSGNIVSNLDDLKEVKAYIDGSYESRYLYTDTIENNGEHNYYLREWLDYDATKEKAANKTYNSKIYIIASPEVKFPDTPTIDFTRIEKNVIGTIDGTANNATYCVSENVCTPSINVEIIDNAVTIPLTSETLDNIVCVSLDSGTPICSNPSDYNNFLMATSVNNYSDSFLDGPIVRNEIETMAVVDNLNVPESAIASWDVSEKQDRSILAWYTDTDSDEYYEVYIGGNGGVLANPDSQDLFSLLTNLTSLNIADLDASQAQNMNNMFSYLYNLKILDLSNFDTTSATNMEDMFSYLRSVSTLDLSNFDTSNVTNMTSMFWRASGLTNLNLTNWDTRNVTDMSTMFQRCENLETLNISNWDTSNVEDMSYMFNYANSLKSLDISHFKTDNVKYMEYMFRDSETITTLNLTKWNTQNVTDMTNMFKGAISLTSLDLSSFVITNVSSVSSMFRETSSTTSLNISKASFANVDTYDRMLESSAVKTIIVKDETAQTFINARITDAGLTNVTVSLAS